LAFLPVALRAALTVFDSFDFGADLLAAAHSRFTIIVTVEMRSTWLI
jgi:hypothetical protein